MSSSTLIALVWIACSSDKAERSDSDGADEDSPTSGGDTGTGDSFVEDSTFDSGTESGTPEDSSGDSGKDSDGTGSLGACDTGVPATVDWSVGLPAADPVAETTCSPLPEIDWTLTTEWSYDLTDFVMNLVVAPQAGEDHATVFFDTNGVVTGLDGRDGSVAVSVPFTPSSDDGNTPAVADADGIPGLEYVTSTWLITRVLDVVDGTWTDITLSSPDDETVAIADIDQDGIGELVLPSASYELDGTLVSELTGGLESTGMMLADMNGDAYPEVLNASGVWNPLDGSGSAWDPSSDPDYSFYGGTVDIEGETQAWFQNGRMSVHRGRADGSLASSTDLNVERYVNAIGDASGDGAPDFCAWDGQELLLVELDGAVVQSWDLSAGADWVGGGGCSMADFDADGVFEVLAQNTSGLFILDGRTGATILFDESFPTSARDTSPIVADVDGDGSAEILLIVMKDGFEGMKIRALGPAKGRWARTRPVWNQLAYDVTSIRDDGTLVASPLPSSTTYGGVFRAQPAHDGDLADLVVEALPTAMPDGSLHVDVDVYNRGSVEAPAGATLALLSFDGTIWCEVSATLIEDAVAPGEVVAASFEADPSELGSRLMVEVRGVGPECDVINDRSPDFEP